MKKATIQMVAEYAGVSRGTVDRVIHNRSYVDAAVREKVLNAIQFLHYTPMHTSAELISSEKTIKLGIIVPTWSNFFNQEIMRGIQDFKKSFHPTLVDVLVRVCSSDLPSEILSAIKDLLSSGVDGLAIASQDSEPLRQQVNQLSASGFPVILYNSDFADCSRLLYVGPDVRKTGRVAGNLMERMVTPDAHFVVAYGSIEIFSHRERAQGFIAYMQENGFPEEAVHTVETYNDYVAFQKLSLLLNRDPAIQGIYLANDTVVGCVEALKEAGLAGKVHVICHDLTESSRSFLQKRRIDFVIEQNIYLESYLALYLLKEHIQLSGAPLRCDAFDSTQILCAENLTPSTQQELYTQLQI